MTTIYSRIAKVSSVLVGQMSPDKRNTQQNYDYISADMVLQEAGKAMSENGLVIIPTITAECTESIEYTDNYGKAKTRFDSVIEFDMIVADDTETIKAHWLGRGTDYSSPDKAVYKAITSGHKYFLMKLFCIGIGNEDSEHDELKNEPRPQVTKPTAQKPTPAVYANEQKPAAKQAAGQKPTIAMLNKLHAIGTQKFGPEWDDARHELIGELTEGRTQSSKDLTYEECVKLAETMKEFSGYTAPDLPKESHGEQDNTMYDNSDADGAWDSMH